MQGAFRVLGVRVDAVQISDVVARIEGWIKGGSTTHYVAVTGMHGVMEAQHDSSFRQILLNADLVVPDGMPLVWYGRRRGFELKRRVYGPELTECFCRRVGAQYRHFFYGGAPGVAQKLANVLHDQYGICIGGAYSPPFRPLTSSERMQVMDLIHGAAPDVLWVGLSTPKQERWMSEQQNSLRVPVMIGVGAAFDILTGRVSQAPRWMREGGLEWLFRLIQEPRRLWRRYLLYGSAFAWNVSLELLGLKRFE